jgi:nucleoside-diphosphate-sugar epimerase
MQTILGSGGAIGSELARALKEYTSEIRLVSRNPKKVNETDILFPADLSDKVMVNKAIEGSEVVYLTVGFQYDIRVWKEKWPAVIKNVVEACEEHRSKLVFFDNVYAIGGDNVKHITENSPISPTSKKGEIRAFVDRYILEEIEKGRIDAIIARAPDFSGPVPETSVLMNLVYNNLVKGKAAQWFCNANLVHTVGYSPDLAKATAILGNTPDAYNRIWNLPADPEPITGNGWVKLFAEELGKPVKLQVVPGWMIYTLGLFVPVLKELYEMRYQYDRDYFFDSSEFCRRFNFSPTLNKEAVRLTVELLKKSNSR